MVTITFPDRETEKRALAFLLGRFSGRVLRSGEHVVPEAALEALADQNIPFTIDGKKCSVKPLKEDPERPYIRYRCLWGRCEHPGRYVIRWDCNELKVCRHHASEFCKRYGLHLPPAKI